MRKGRIAVIGGGSRGLALAFAAALAGRHEPLGPEVKIREEPPLPVEPYLEHEPKVKDWKQRDRQRPRRK